MRRIYPSLFRMTFGHLSLWANYPERQASYPVSVRRIKCLPMASFIPHVRDQSLGTPLPPAIGFRSSRLLRDLWKRFHAPFRFTTCPAYQIFWRCCRYLTFPIPIPKIFGIRDRTLESQGKTLPKKTILHPKDIETFEWLW